MRKAHDFIEKDLKRCYTVFRNLCGEYVQIDIFIELFLVCINYQIKYKSTKILSDLTKKNSVVMY